MDRTQVESGNLRSVGYDEQQRLLEVEFHNPADKRKHGPVYQYYGVPPEVYVSLLYAPSKGEFFARNIKPVYAYKRVSG